MPLRIGLDPIAAIAAIGSVAALSTSGFLHPGNGKTTPNQGSGPSQQAQMAANKEHPKDQPGNLFSVQDFSWIQTHCQRGQQESSTGYGAWHQVQGCVLPAKGQRPLLPLDSALYGSNGQVLGLQRMIVNPGRLEAFSQLITSSTRIDQQSCSRLGDSGYPLLVATRKQLCDPLTYDQL